MARIPEVEVQRLREEIAVQRLIEDAGVVLKKSGKDFAGRCPLHEDDTASLVVTPAKNLWHCFGCGVGGGCRFTLSLSVLHLNLSVTPTTGIPFLMRFNESNH